MSTSAHGSVRIRVSGNLPPESRNTFGARAVTRLRRGNPSAGVNIEAEAGTPAEAAPRDALAGPGLSQAMPAEAGE